MRTSNGWGVRAPAVAAIAIAVGAPIACSATPVGEATMASVDLQAAATQLGDPLPGLTADQQTRFAAGKAKFGATEGAADGLGPVYNDTSCGACHAGPALGGGADRVETRFGAVTNGQFDPLAQLGGSLIQENGIGRVRSCDYVGELVPPQATVRAGRRTTPLFGLGLVDAVPEATLRALAASEAQQSPATAGVVSVVPNVSTGQTSVGRFGWKAQNPSIFQFCGDAYLNEMGVTNPQFPNENCPQGDCSALKCNPDPTLNDDGADVSAFSDFITLLAPPAPLPVSPSASEGQQRFAAIGCANCHTPTLTTGPSPIAALANVTFHPYSDFLLHDMGGLGDGISQNAAGGAAMRTAPLWGLHAITSFLHDGRAKTIGDAILAHDGQGRAARDAFAALPAAQQSKVLAFLGSL